MSGEHLLVANPVNIKRERDILASCGDEELIAVIGKWPNHAPGIAAKQLLDSRRQESSFWSRWPWKITVAVISSLVAAFVAKCAGLT